MNIRERSRRALVIAAVMAMVMGSQVFADEHVDEDSASVTVATVTGQRSLELTGADVAGEVGAGPALLAFNETSTTAPFGVAVTDLTYPRIGYQVDSRLSNLYRIDPSEPGGFDCGSAIASEHFSIGYLSLTSVVERLQEDLRALLDTDLTFLAPADTLDGLSITLLGVEISLTGSTDETIEVVGALLDEVLDADEVTLMQVDDGAAGSFDDAAAHPACDGGTGSPTDIGLQTGTPSDAGLDLGALADTLTDGVVSPAQAIAEGLLPEGADEPGGVVFEATRTLLAELFDVSTSLIGDSLVADVVEDLQLTDLVLDLIGQSGVYANVPQLAMAEAALDASTGLYHGRMYVTLLDTE